MVEVAAAVARVAPAARRGRGPGRAAVRRGGPIAPRYAARVNGVTGSVVVTKLGVLTGIDPNLRGHHPADT